MATATPKAASATKIAPAVKSDKEKEAAKAATYENGFRAAREAKGYGRIAAAEALEITTSALWKLETQAEGKELAEGLKALKALPQAPKAERKKAEPKAKAAATAKAKGKVKAKPAEATDLI